MAPLLNAYSQYSLGYGVKSPEELVEAAARLGAECLALTDIETLAGQIRFHHACRSVGLQPLTGVELRPGFSRKSPGDPAGRLILLARDETGYGNLCRIVNRRRSQSPRSDAPADPLDALQGDTEGLFLLAGDLRTLARLRESGGADQAFLRLLVPSPGAAGDEANLSSIAAGARVPIVSSPSLLASRPLDARLHELLLAIGSGRTVGEIAAAGRDGGAFPRGTGARGALRESQEEAHRIAQECRLDLTVRRSVKPRLPGLTPDSAPKLLKQACRQALESRKSGRRVAHGRYESRLERELNVIDDLGFSEYFLTVAEIARGARELDIPTAGRGSAAGSLVAYLLEITDLDPIEHDLIFERFLHQRRGTPPDIDLDVASSGRERLISWVARRFGNDRVAGVGSYSTYRARSGLRVGLAALGLAPRTVEKVVRGFEPGEAVGDDETLRVQEYLASSGDRLVVSAAPLIGRLVGVLSHLSAHPSGLVIGEAPLSGSLPLERASGGRVVTQYDYRSVESAGFLKIDLLGNHFLSEMQEALATARRRAGLGGREGRAEPPPGGRQLSTGDDGTLRTIDEADTIGCFQIESPAVRSVLRRMPIRSFGDLEAALAVVRPGAASGAAKERFLRRARGEERFDPLEVVGGESALPGGTAEEGGLRRRLERSNGVLLYDEDIMLLLSVTGGLDLAEADALRTAIIAAGEDRQELRRLAGQFEKSAQHAGLAPAVARRAWVAAERFSAYSFAHAHAASFASLAWKAAWLRTHHPCEFGCALINNYAGMYPLRTVAAAIERWGVTLMAPDVNESVLESAIEEVSTNDGDGCSLRLGLRSIKGLSRRAAQAIVAGRPFAELAELISTVKPARRELTALLLSGACDGLPPLSTAGYPFVHEVVLAGLAGEAPPERLEEITRRFESTPPPGGEEGSRLPLQEESVPHRLDRYRLLVRVRNELRYLEMHPTAHPMHLLRPEASSLGCTPVARLTTQTETRVSVAGVLAASRRVATSAGEMRFLTIEDETGLVEGRLPVHAATRFGAVMTTPGPYLFEGRLLRQATDIVMEVDRLLPFHER